jgi:hypothetical protein
MTDEQLLAEALRLCELMEADDRDFLKGERIGLIWQIQGQLIAALRKRLG